jgi:N utilization substance protein B
VKPSSKGEKIRPAARRNARQWTLQALYQWRMAGTDLSRIEQQFLVDNDPAKVDVDYFRRLLHGIPPVVTELDHAFEPFLDRSLKELDPIELSILRLGCFELMHCPDIPYRVVINEGIELAKRFGASASHRYVNGVLDRLAVQQRAGEVRANRKRQPDGSD